MRKALKVQHSLDFYNKQILDQQCMISSQSQKDDKDSKLNFQKGQINMDVELNIQLNSRSHLLKQQYYERYKNVQNTKKGLFQKQEKENNFLSKTQQAVLNFKGQLTQYQIQNGYNDQNRIFNRGNLAKQIYHSQDNQQLSVIQSNLNEIKEQKGRYQKDVENNFKKEKNIYKDVNRQTPQSLFQIEILTENKNIKQQQPKINQDKQISQQFECDTLQRECNSEVDERKKQIVSTNQGEKNCQQYFRNSLNFDEFKENFKQEANSNCLLNNSKQCAFGSMINKFCDDSNNKNFGSQIYRKHKISNKPIKFVQQSFQRNKRPPIVFKQKRNEQNQSLERNKNSFQLNNSNQQIDKQTKSYSQNQKKFNQINLKKIISLPSNFEQSPDFQIDQCQQSYRSIPASDLSAREQKIKAQILNKMQGNKYGLKKEETQPNNLESLQVENYDEQNINNFLSYNSLIKHLQIQLMIKMKTVFYQLAEIKINQFKVKKYNLCIRITRVLEIIQILRVFKIILIMVKLLPFMLSQEVQNKKIQTVERVVKLDLLKNLKRVGLEAQQSNHSVKMEKYRLTRF